MQLTIDIENPTVYESLVQFLKSLGISIVGEEPKTTPKRKLSSLKRKSIKNEFRRN